MKTRATPCCAAYVQTSLYWLALRDTVLTVLCLWRCLPGPAAKRKRPSPADRTGPAHAPAEHINCIHDFERTDRALAKNRNYLMSRSRVQRMHLQNTSTALMTLNEPTAHWPKTETISCHALGSSACTCRTHQLHSWIWTDRPRTGQKQKLSHVTLFATLRPTQFTGTQQKGQPLRLVTCAARPSKLGGGGGGLSDSSCCPPFPHPPLERQPYVLPFWQNPKLSTGGSHGKCLPFPSLAVFRIDPGFWERTYPLGSG